MKKLLGVGAILFFLLFQSVQARTIDLGKLEKKIDQKISTLSLEQAKKLNTKISSAVSKLEKYYVETPSKTVSEIDNLRWTLYHLILQRLQNSISLNEAGGMEKIYKDILDSSYILGSKEAKVSVIIYEDLQCPYCAQLHNDGLMDEIEKEFGSDVNIIFQHFPLPFHEYARSSSLQLECIGKEKGATGFYEAVDEIYASEDPSPENIEKIASKMGLSKDKVDVDTCSDMFDLKIDNQILDAQALNINGTPTVIIINATDYSFETIVGAMPVKTFIEAIEKKLQ